MTYEKSLRHQGHQDKALETLRDAFLFQNFRLLTNESDSFEVAGPGMMNSRENPLRGVSRARVRVGEADITIRAELGAVRRMQYFAVFFPPSLVLILTAILFFALPNGEMFARTTVPSLLLTWFIIGPIMAWRLRKHTVSALDALLENAAYLSKPTH